MNDPAIHAPCLNCLFCILYRIAQLSIAILRSAMSCERIVALHHLVSTISYHPSMYLNSSLYHCCCFHSLRTRIYVHLQPPL
ncbi:hypothetical protein FKP32DRAFT_257583 [Trametes sanguinea]|nr:hypothetical protein FKP32DRAFT_257583 [Trametes sanguinea]